MIYDGCLYDIDHFTYDDFMDAIHVLDVCSRFYDYDDVDYVSMYAMNVLYLWYIFEIDDAIF